MAFKFFFVVTLTKFLFVTFYGCYALELLLGTVADVDHWSSKITASWILTTNFCCKPSEKLVFFESHHFLNLVSKLLGIVPKKAVLSVLLWTFHSRSAAASRNLSRRKTFRCHAVNLTTPSASWLPPGRAFACQSRHPERLSANNGAPRGRWAFGVPNQAALLLRPSFTIRSTLNPIPVPSVRGRSSLDIGGHDCPPVHYILYFLIIGPPNSRKCSGVLLRMQALRKLVFGSLCYWYREKLSEFPWFHSYFLIRFCEHTTCILKKSVEIRNTGFQLFLQLFLRGRHFKVFALSF